MNAGIGPGPTLRAARQAMNVEPREVADALNLPLSVVEAIEENDYAQLPNAVFARGYVRSYAKLLELDPDPIVLQFPMPEQSVVENTMSVERASPFASLTATAQRLLREQQQLVLVAGAIVVGLLLVMLLVWLLSDSEAEAAITPAAANPTTPANAPLVTPGLQPVAPAPGAIQADVVNNTTQSVDGLVTQRLDAGDGTMFFEFTDECWLEVRAADGQVLYSDLGKPSKPLKFTGRGPFSILLGYAPAATLQFNGEAVALAPHTRNNVATLVLGQ